MLATYGCGPVPDFDRLPRRAAFCAAKRTVPESPSTRWGKVPWSRCCADQRSPARLGGDASHDRWQRWSSPCDAMRCDAVRPSVGEAFRRNAPDDGDPPRGRSSRRRRIRRDGARPTNHSAKAWRALAPPTNSILSSPTRKPVRYGLSSSTGCSAVDGAGLSDTALAPGIRFFRLPRS
jgi:hypothetical protein